MNSSLAFVRGSRRIRLLLGVVVLMAFAVLVSAPPQAEAVSNYQNCHYYADAAHTQLIGQGIIYCNGNSTRWGTFSIYVSCITLACCGTEIC